MTNEVPLIWTSKGNLPVDDLDYATYWEVTPAYIKFREVFTLDGEVVRENAHVYANNPMTANTEVGTFV